MKLTFDDGREIEILGSGSWRAELDGEPVDIDVYVTRRGHRTVTPAKWCAAR